jgi:hypothetical protein
MLVQHWFIQAQPGARESESESESETGTGSAVGGAPVTHFTVHCSLVPGQQLQDECLREAGRRVQDGRVQYRPCIR